MPKQILVPLYKCGFCRFKGWVETPDTYNWTCGKMKSKIIDNWDGIPEWCPLPDLEESTIKDYQLNFSEDDRD